MPHPVHAALAQFGEACRDLTFRQSREFPGLALQAEADELRGSLAQDTKGVAEFAARVGGRIAVLQAYLEAVKQAARSSRPLVDPPTPPPRRDASPPPFSPPPDLGGWYSRDDGPPSTAPAPRRAPPTPQAPDSPGESQNFHANISQLGASPPSHWEAFAAALQAPRVDAADLLPSAHLFAPPRRAIQTVTLKPAAGPRAWRLRTPSPETSSELDVPETPPRKRTQRAVSVQPFTDTQPQGNP